jgi:lipid-A-disaccharide synthase
MPRLFGLLRKLFLKVRYVSLVNLIARREVVRELVADTFSVDNIRRELDTILPGGEQRPQMLSDYEEIHRLLGDSQAPETAARIIINKLHKQ